MIQNFRDFEVYQRSYAIALKMYQETSTWPKEETYGLISQVKRASTSVPMNIAEGYGKRESAAEFKRFLQMSIGSCDEMKVLLDFAKDLRFMSPEKHNAYEQEYEEIGKMLYRLWERWK